MTYFVTDKCIGEVYATCVAVCPVDCIYYVSALPAQTPGAGKPFMVIDPKLCIDCGACAPACPINAIREDQGGGAHAWLSLNAYLAQQVTGCKAPVTRGHNEAPRRPENRLIDD